MSVSESEHPLLGQEVMVQVSPNHHVCGFLLNVSGQAVDLRLADGSIKRYGVLTTKVTITPRWVPGVNCLF